jgi:dihydrofolate reductase
MEAIYAIDSNYGLSKNGTISWNCKKDMIFFMNQTKNNVVIMGNTTYFSLPIEHRPLRNRFNVVLTRKPIINENENPNILFTNDSNIHEMILNNREKYCEKYKYLKKDFKIFFIGGKTIYEQFIPLCSCVWVTQLKCDYDCDLFMNYDYSNYSSEVYEEDDELKIIKYTRK